MTKYKHRLIILAHRARQEDANKAAADWDPDTGGHGTFANLSYVRREAEAPELRGLNSGEYSICNTAATDEMRGKIYAALENGDVEAVYDLNERDAHNQRKWDLVKVLKSQGLEATVQLEEFNGRNTTS